MGKKKQEKNAILSTPGIGGKEKRPDKMIGLIGRSARPQFQRAICIILHLRYDYVFLHFFFVLLFRPMELIDYTVVAAAAALVVHCESPSRR